MKPLEGIRVLDLSRILAGPVCTQILADLGAEVWKLESPWGDDTRRWGPPFQEGESAYYLSANRGKKSVAVNLKDPRGQALVRELAARADVLVENFKAGTLARYGLDYASLAPLNPGLVYCSITGFGQTGPRAQEPGYDVALQGITGIMSITGEPDGPPVKVGVAWIDVLTGLYAAIGILTALWERASSGKGQYIDLALFDVGLASLVNQAQAYLMTGEVPGRLGSAHPQIVPYQAFQAQDKWFILAVGNDEQYRRMTEAIQHPELWEDPRFQTNAGRVAHREALVGRLAAIFRTRPRQAWLEVFHQAGVPATPVNDLAEAFADPQAAARGVLWRVAHPTLGALPLVANPLQFMSRTPAAPAGPPPLLGEHTRQVLGAVLGVEEAELERLERDGVIRSRA
ncbi:CaiB/BaiF CoA transferase family protein [Marinithermus hydrothermalis]|uniref:Formyl-CoA transferase n=1 Tax=Marinithermus hydrothermalis (strain DSM 14884 / JCM 11576 / T1) TaxID=869210 RepID=F2NQ50_MARHT|nr:CoA transferase [Marinithermus hydrothermalis]AEB11361.1 Formyl-CoA transferase [Marinithermus hydrothermalis DSM 14884]